MKEYEATYIEELCFLVYFFLLKRNVHVVHVKDMAQHTTCKLSLWNLKGQKAEFHTPSHFDGRRKEMISIPGKQCWSNVQCFTLSGKDTAVSKTHPVLVISDLFHLESLRTFALSYLPCHLPKATRPCSLFTLNMTLRNPQSLATIPHHGNKGNSGTNRARGRASARGSWRLVGVGGRWAKLPHLRFCRRPWWAYMHPYWGEGRLQIHSSRCSRRRPCRRCLRPRSSPDGWWGTLPCSRQQVRSVTGVTEKEKVRNLKCDRSNLTQTRSGWTPAGVNASIPSHIHPWLFPVQIPPSWWEFTLSANFSYTTQR